MAQKSKPSVFIIIFILLLIIGGGLLILNKKSNNDSTSNNIFPTKLISNTPQPLSSKFKETNTWKTYTNTQYGFSFKYPPTLNYKSDSLLPDTVFFSKNEISFQKNAEGPITPLTLIIKKDSSVSKEIEELKNINKYSNFKDQEIIQGGISGRKISGIIKGESYNIGKFNSEVFFPKNNLIIQLSFIGIEGINESNFEQIISTFKFTK